MDDSTTHLGRTVWGAGSAALRVALLPLLLCVVVVVALLYGSTSLPLSNVLEILLYKLGVYGGAASWPAYQTAIIWDIRLPEVLAAALVGAGLGVAGALFQAVLRNALADPYVIGTSAGAQLGVTISFLLPAGLAFAGFSLVQGLSFVGALATVLVVYGLARTPSGTPVVTLILAGFVMSSFLISASSFLTVVNQSIDRVVTWSLGGIAVNSWQQLGVAAPLILGGSAGAVLFAPRLDVLLLGEEQAAHLGLHVERLKLTVIVLASFLTALAVTLGGIIAFVGLIVPHAVRLIYGPRHRVLIPASAVGGAIFLVLCDLVARTLLAPRVIPVGIATAVLGAPFFLYLLRRGRKHYAL